ncbi:nucleotidyl transferase AbiEii/AbiGii toxin family protein [candidate division WOR-3 bacterium]|nr:nucleotidyl transferase AbiEii/AbiGii toxin family protein [candidate division WOR-3 bacterium]
MLRIMEREIAAQEAKKSGTDIVNIVREYWEVLVLKGMFESPYGKDLIFKGGTALRLVYGSPRFSEDLDFSLTSDSLKGRFCPFATKVIAPFAELSLSDCAEKFYTYLAEIKVAIPYLSYPFRIKVEISKRKQKNYKWELKLVSSSTVNLQVLLQVASLEQLYKDKQACLRNRQKPKDIFDLWYLCEQRGTAYQPKRISLTQSILRRDLRKLLPKTYWPIIEKLKK